MTWSPQSKAPAGPVEAIAEFADGSGLGAHGAVELADFAGSRATPGEERCEQEHVKHLTPFLRWAEDKPTSSIFPVGNYFSTDRSLHSVEGVFDGRELMYAHPPLSAV